MSLRFAQVLQSTGTSGPRSYYLLETFILRLLETELRSQGKELQVHVAFGRPDHHYVQVDALAPDGIGNLPGPTVVELKLRLRTQATFHLLVDQLRRIAETAQARSLLLIVADHIPEPLSKKLMQLFGGEDAKVQFALWDANDLDQLLARHEAVAEDLLRRLPTARLELALRKDEVDWRTRRSHHLERLRQLYAENNIVLFLGAGVSVDAGLPAWGELLDALFATLIAQRLNARSAISDDEVSAIIKRFRDKSDSSPLLTARYLRRGLSEGTVDDLEPFLDAVTNVLYKLADPVRAESSELLNQLARMCIPRRSGPRVRAVVTYNFDDLFERALERIPVTHKSIYRDGDIPGRDELPVYHVHGFLPRDRARYTGLDKSTVVFSEERYHELFQDPYHWSNLVQLSLLRDYSCVMVGLSLSDPNLRRLLEIAARRNEAQRHYAFLRRMTPSEFMFEGKKKVLDASEASVQEFLDSHHRLTEELLRELGLNVVWYEEYRELPGLLAQIQN